MLEIMRAVPLTTRAKRSAISCRCELNVSIQINKGSSYRMVAYDDVLHNPGSVCVSLPPLPGRALFASVGITSSMASTLFECIIYLAVSTASSRSLSLSLCLPSESFALLRRMFSYHKVRQHNVVVAIVVRQHRPTPPPNPLCPI